MSYSYPNGYWQNPNQFQPEVQVQGNWFPWNIVNNVPNFYFNTQNQPDVPQHYINLAPVENQQQPVVVPYNEFSQQNGPSEMGIEEFLQSLEDNQGKLEGFIPEMENLAAEIPVEPNAGVMDYNRAPFRPVGGVLAQPQVPQRPVQVQIPGTTFNNNEAPGIVNYYPTASGPSGRGRKKNVSGERTKLDRCTCPNCSSGYNKQPGVKKVHSCHMPNCKKQYCTTSHLRAHLLTHDGIRPFGCNFPGCSKSFTRSDELARHTRTHTGDRNYPCLICGKKFMRSDHLSKHVKVHSAEKKPRKPRGRAAGKVQELMGGLPLEQQLQQQQQQQQLKHLVNMTFLNDGSWTINS